MRAKGELIALVAALRACRLRFREIGLLLFRTPERIGQIAITYRLDPPKFETREQAMVWLTAHHPALAAVLAAYLKKQNET